MSARGALLWVQWVFGSLCRALHAGAAGVPLPPAPSAVVLPDRCQCVAVGPEQQGMMGHSANETLWERKTHRVHMHNNYVAIPG